MAKQATPTSDAQPTPESEAVARIAELQERAKALESEVRTALGKLSNRNPQAMAKLEQEATELRARAEKLQRALYLLLRDALSGHQVEPLKIQAESLRQAAVEYCKRNNINPELWKNLVS